MVVVGLMLAGVVDNDVATKKKDRAGVKQMTGSCDNLEHPVPAARLNHPAVSRR